jgi:signal transduction histidine kinase
MKVTAADFWASDCIEEVSDMFHDWLQIAKINLVTDVDENLCAQGDGPLTVRILTNLFVNAIKYTPAGASVTLRVRENANTVLFEVCDQGPGVPAEMQSLIFERWHGTASSKAKAPASTGLGLYIARRFVELQNGRIGVKSEPGNGSTFWFTLPKTKQRSD